ncbi:MAG: hypothetical protein ACFFAO_02610 [Candidatus Hermodarchaeota archaeon]
MISFDNQQKEHGIIIDPKNTNMLYLYINFLTKSKSIDKILFSLAWFYYVLFFFFYILCVIMLTNEITRKTKILLFPFNFFPNLIMSEEEKKSYCSYLYFGIGQLLAAFMCPPMVYFAILGLSAISDLVTSQIGIRYGKKNISWNVNKTYEGSIAGTIVSFVITLIFIGPIYALIFSIAFLLFDLFTNDPININDNLLIPIGCAIIFVLIRFSLDLDYNSVILLILFK